MADIETFVFVYLDGVAVPAGLLRLHSEPRASYATFAYGNRYLERPDRVAIDPVTLPLPPAGTRQEFRTEEGFAVFNGIRDAAPDGWGQYLMYKAMGERTPSEADLLLASGDHRVGALAFGPTLEAPRRLAPWGEADAPGEQFTLAELAAAAEEAQEVDQLSENLRPLLTAGSSLGGARPKAATTIEGQSWIAKFPARNDTFPECRVELATMRLAAECGLDVPSLRFEQLLGRDIYLIERFDRRLDGNRMLRTSFASGLTMLGAHESEVSRYAYADLGATLRQHGTAVRRDLEELFRRMVFNILVTNDDDHLRNHGFLWDGRGGGCRRSMTSFPSRRWAWIAGSCWAWGPRVARPALPTRSRRSRSSTWGRRMRARSLSLWPIGFMRGGVPVSKRQGSTSPTRAVLLPAFAWRTPNIAQSADRPAISRRRASQGPGAPEGFQAARASADAVEKAAAEEGAALVMPAAAAISRSRIALPGLKCTDRLAGTGTAKPLRGFRPVRASCSRVKKAPNPRSSTRPPAASWSTTASKKRSTIFSISCAESSGFSLPRRATSSDRTMAGACFTGLSLHPR
jgi:serine/threonine-protein kinase HipA